MSRTEKEAIIVGGILMFLWGIGKTGNVLQRIDNGFNTITGDIFNPHSGVSGSGSGSGATNNPYGSIKIVQQPSTGDPPVFVGPTNLQTTDTESVSECTANCQAQASAGLTSTPFFMCESACEGGGHY